MVTLETDRLTLRMLRESDFDPYAEMCADPEVMRYIGDGQPLVRPMAWRNLAQMIGHWSLRATTAVPQLGGPTQVSRLD
jgi:RimJ/RimL family protein N-acetyltransferase